MSALGVSQVRKQALPRFLECNFIVVGNLESLPRLLSALLESLS